MRGGEAALSRTEEPLVGMTNRGSCRTLRDDLPEEGDRLAREGRFDQAFLGGGRRSPAAFDSVTSWDTCGIDESCAHEHQPLTPVTEH